MTSRRVTMPHSMPRPSVTRNKVLSGDQLDQILHARVDRDRTVMDAARDLGEQHVSGLFGRVPEQQAQKIALGDRADVAPLGAQDPEWR